MKTARFFLLFAPLVMVLFSTMDAFAQAGGKKNVVEKDVFVAQQDTVATPMMAAVDGKIGLVLAGGGAKGFYHIGVIKALEENPQREEFN